MSSMIRRVGVSAVVALTALTGTAAVAEEGVRQFKPLTAVSVHLGSKHGIGYFEQDGKVCQLTLVVSEEPRGDVIPDVTPSRFKVAVAPGKAARFDSGEGTALQFFCGPGAMAMTVEPVKQVAYAKVPQK